ncbi:hypothetical protein FB451DRAFT_1387891 [Mycena latifolia]|nr:hypothetical protein FB451DRAFT_1387891 [Mycena latifolia]
MADADGQNNNGGGQNPQQNQAAGNAHQVASFKIPQAWDTSKPKFDSDDHEDLLNFVEQVNQVFRLGNITDDAAKKAMFVDYLPFKKRSHWRSLPIYQTGTYEEFLEEIYKSYPEVKTEETGSIENLMRICKRYGEIKLIEEGRLRRFGVEFLSVVTKLMDLTAPNRRAILTNLQACHMYLDTMEESFATSLRTAISSTELMRKQFGALLGPAGAALGNDPGRKGDPIEVADLIKMAETMSASQAGSSYSGGVSLAKEPTTLRPASMPLVKTEKQDARIEELGGAIANLRDMFMASQKEQASHNGEVLRALQQVSKPTPPHMAPAQTTSQSNSNGQERWNNKVTPNKGGDSRDCYYCDQGGHFSRECISKEEHISKGFLMVENGKYKLGDGNLIPSGPGSQRQRVEDYWRGKALNQNWHAIGPTGYSSYYHVESNDKAPDAADTALDEIRTLKVRLARAEQVSQQSLANVAGVVQPTFAATVSQGSAIPNGLDLNQALQTLLIRGLQASGELPVTQDQFAITRGAAKNNGGNSGSNF